MPSKFKRYNHFWATQISFLSYIDLFSLFLDAATTIAHATLIRNFLYPRTNAEKVNIEDNLILIKNKRVFHFWHRKPCYYS